jgi:hypothetical protein
VEVDMARYDPLRKLERNLAIVRYREEHPELALREVGEIFGGLSPQHVWKICHAMKKRGGQ